MNYRERLNMVKSMREDAEVLFSKIELTEDALEKDVQTTLGEDIAPYFKNLELESKIKIIEKYGLKWIERDIAPSITIDFSVLAANGWDASDVLDLIFQKKIEFLAGRIAKDGHYADSNPDDIYRL